jgi:hypothetical protein
MKGIEYEPDPKFDRAHLWSRRIIGFIAVVSSVLIIHASLTGGVVVQPWVKVRGPKIPPPGQGQVPTAPKEAMDAAAGAAIVGGAGQGVADDDRKGGAAVGSQEELK